VTKNLKKNTDNESFPQKKKLLEKLQQINNWKNTILLFLTDPGVPVRDGKRLDKR